MDNKFEMLPQFSDPFKMDEAFENPEFFRWAQSLEHPQREKLLYELIMLVAERDERPQLTLMDRLTGDLPIVPPFDYIRYLLEDLFGY